MGANYELETSYPRKGTETEDVFLSKPINVELETSYPRKGTETLCLHSFQRILELLVRNNISPQGDGNNIKIIVEDVLVL